MEATQQNSFQGWAVVEIFGHQKAIGFVTTEYYGPACMFRVDTPELPEREVILDKPAYAATSWDEKGERYEAERWVPAGSKVKRQASPASSQLLGVGAIYRMIPCTELTARKVIEEFEKRPLILLELPKQKTAQLLPGEAEADESREWTEADEEEERHSTGVREDI